VAPRKAAAPDHRWGGDRGRDTEQLGGELVSKADTEAPAEFQAIVVAEWRRNSRETLRVSLDRYNDAYTVDCRSWFKANDGALKPTRSGLTVSVRHLPTLAKALADALEQARGLGLIPHDDAGGQ
jgi:Transcriptional Coactivator p15 (PC4)